MTKIRASNNNNHNNTKSGKHFTNNRNSRSAGGIQNNNNNSRRRRIQQTTVGNPTTTTLTRQNKSQNANSIQATSGKMLQTHHQQQQQAHTVAAAVANPNSNFKAATNSNLVNINNLNYATLPVSGSTNNTTSNVYRVNNNSKKINNKSNKQTGRNSFSSGVIGGNVTNMIMPSSQVTTTTTTSPFVQFNNNNSPNTRYQSGRGGPATRNMTTRRQQTQQQVQQTPQIHPMMFQPIQTNQGQLSAVLNDVTVNLTRDEPRLVIFNANLNNSQQQQQQTKNMFHFNNSNNSNKFNNYHTFQFHKISHGVQQKIPVPQHNQQTQQAASGNVSHSFNPFRSNHPNPSSSSVRTRSYYKNLRTQLQLHHHNYQQSGNTTNSKFQSHPHGVLMPASGKYKAPYNTTQYIMFDYSRRMPALKDLQCPSEQQQFDNDWDMAMLQEALTPSATFKPIIMPTATIIHGDDSEDEDDEVELIYMDPNHVPIKKSTSDSQLFDSSAAGSSQTGGGGYNSKARSILADTPMTTDDDEQKQLLSTSI